MRFRGGIVGQAQFLGDFDNRMRLFPLFSRREGCTIIDGERMAAASGEERASLLRREERCSKR